jgi:hypothetical protein
MDSEVWYVIEYEDNGDWYEASNQSMDTLESAVQRLTDEQDQHLLVRF